MLNKKASMKEFLNQYESYLKEKGRENLDKFVTSLQIMRNFMIQNDLENEEVTYDNNNVAFMAINHFIKCNKARINSPFHKYQLCSFISQLLPKDKYEFVDLGEKTTVKSKIRYKFAFNKIA